MALPHTEGMSRAFVKEDGGERWTPPAARPQPLYRTVRTTPDGPEVVQETDDLLQALHGLPAGAEIRDRSGRLMARG